MKRPRDRGGVPRWNGPRTVCPLESPPSYAWCGSGRGDYLPHEAQKNAGPSGGPHRRRQSLSARRRSSSRRPRAGGTSRRPSPPCSRRHALVILPASFLAGQVGRQARHAPSLPQLYSGADARVSLCRYDDPRHSEQRTVSITINTKKDDAFLEAAKCRPRQPTPDTTHPLTHHARTLPPYLPAIDRDGTRCSRSLSALSPSK